MTTGTARGSLGLVGAAFLFGSTFVVVKDALDHAGPVPFLAVRFLFAAVLLAPVALRRAGRATPGERRDGFIGGLLLLGGFVFQTVGLLHTSSSSSAFITYLLVVFVPLITAFRLRRLPAPGVVLGVVIAVAGLLLLSGGPSGFGLGEWLTVACALCFALHMIFLGGTSHRHDPVRLTFWQILTVGALCLVPGLFLGGYAFGADVWAAAAFCGLGATATAFFLMVWAQQVVPPTRAALILLLEPVFAALLGYLVGDRLGWAGLAGAALIVVAILVTEVVPAVLTARPRPGTLAP